MELETLNNILQDLSKIRPIFHSEADFQHALAIKLSINNDIRLERRFFVNEENFYVDILLLNHGKPSIAIELKYKTAILDITHQNEDFNLKNQAANDLGRYHFREDIYWLEQLKNKKLIDKAFSIFLTNDAKYWNHPTTNETMDQEFRIHQGAQIIQEAQWKNAPQQHWTINYCGLSLYQQYSPIEWENYSCITQEGSLNLKFKYVLLEI